MKENFAYLKDVLGIRYVRIDHKEVSRVSASSMTNHMGDPTVKPTVTQPSKGISSTMSSMNAPTAQSPTKTVGGALSSESLAKTAGSLKDLSTKIHDCERCKLSKTRTQLVFGQGNPKAQLMFVGEGPGDEEDKQGLPFVGRSGQLLTKMIQAMGLSREDVFIANVVKCRPPDNRNPAPDEIEQCSPFLRAQIRLIKPKIIVALGTFAAQTLLNTEEKITALRAQNHEYEGVKLVATYHPAYLLRNPSQKKEVWNDLQVVMKDLGLKVVKNMQ